MFIYSGYCVCDCNVT